MTRRDDSNYFNWKMKKDTLPSLQKYKGLQEHWTTVCQNLENLDKILRHELPKLTQNKI